MSILKAKKWFRGRKEEQQVIRPLPTARLDFNFDLDQIQLPANQIPSWRLQEACARGAEGKWLFYCWGGLGDVICGEPVIRWAYENLEYKDFAIASDYPELFNHIPCKKFKIEGNAIVGGNIKDWYMAPIIYPFGHLTWEFYSHCLINGVDYASINVLNMQLPVKNREIQLPNFAAPDLDWNKAVVVHPGKHWQSKTFPASFWQQVCGQILLQGLVPVIVGKTVDDNVGVVNFDANPGCIDLREKCTMKEFIAIAKTAHCIISNDSAIIHAAAAGNAFIGAIATCKHADYISHWRRGQWQWRFKNLAKFDVKLNATPFTKEDITVEYLDPKILEKMLPDPVEVGVFARNCMVQYARDYDLGYCQT